MKAAVYCRLSEEDRNKRRDTDDSGSIQNQKALLLQYAKTQGWDVYGVYSDDDYTGSDRSRPAFRQLLQDAEQRRFEIVLCKTQSRFTRELELVEKYLHGLFPRWGIRFVSVVSRRYVEKHPKRPGEPQGKRVSYRLHRPLRLPKRPAPKGPSID